MRLPALAGIIRRRILVNYRVDPEVVQRILPTRFRPKLQRGYAIAGICLIRLEHIRPKRLPEMMGISSENAAHRIAVTWIDDIGIPQEGVYIPRRDSDSEINCLLGGRVFPGELHPANFQVTDTGSQIVFSMQSHDKAVAINLQAGAVDHLPAASIFRTLDEASQFFENGSLGYSATRDAHRLDGMKLHTTEWRVEPLAIQNVFSSYFSDETNFARGTAVFDHALLMRNIAHEWLPAADLCA